MIVNRIRVKRVANRALFYLGMTSLVVFLGFPLYWMLASSVQDESALFSHPPTLFPVASFTLQPMYRVFFLEQHPMLTWLWNSAWVCAVSSALSVMLGLWGGYSLSRFRFRGASITGFMILLTQMLPASLIVIPLYMIMTDLRLSNSLWGLMLTYMSFNVPFSIWMLKGFVDGIPRELEEAGLIDGCSRMGTLMRITVPVIIPGVIATFVFAFIAAWGEYVFALTLIDSVNRWTYSVGVASLKGEYLVAWNEIMSASFVSTLPVLLLFLYMQRYLLAGLAAGGVKG